MLCFVLLIKSRVISQVYVVVFFGKKMVFKKQFQRFDINNNIQNFSSYFRQYINVA